MSSVRSLVLLLLASLLFSSCAPELTGFNPVDPSHDNDGDGVTEEDGDCDDSDAARFAGKEAVSKAFGTGIGEKLNWHDLEIVHHERGRPMVRLHGKAKVLLMELGGKSVHISLSHSDGQAAAMAVLEG